MSDATREELLALARKLLVEEDGDVARALALIELHREMRLSEAKVAAKKTKDAGKRNGHNPHEGSGWS